ncbi:T9SS type B sorting domain-containing protein [Flavobacterium sp. RSSA_27]|uniref:T9SS type B sorting domain-containing protein n=1 Tax=Flavobacterium sp. RSSA_27 TaxID=3447667 RepID=UPI003F6421B9
MLLLVSSFNLYAIDPPKIAAIGNQLYCPGSKIKIVESISILADPNDTGTEAFYIQISSGFVEGEDFLSLPFTPLMTYNYDKAIGKLKLFPQNGGKLPYSEYIKAIESIEFESKSTKPSGTKKFSISLGQANYLPSTNHYYEFISSIGITWKDAKIAAENKSYYNLKGYLATILTADEAQFAGAQASGTGWIGGTDETTEGVWNWVTGPEGLANGGAGTNFWNGGPNGSTTTYAYWNNLEPNNLNGFEHYAHITAPGVGIKGSWNDLGNTGDTTPGSDYQPKGYIVEYGGMPGDPAAPNFTTTTSITIPAITSTGDASRCDPGSVQLQATASMGEIYWYDQYTGGNLVGTGPTFTTPILQSTKEYYVAVITNGCTTLRSSVTATINTTPTIISTNSPVTSCGPNVISLEAASSLGPDTIYWFEDATSSNIIGKGNVFYTAYINSNKTFYVEARNNNCSNTTRVPIEVIIYPLPIVADEEKIICQSNPITLDAGLTGMSYLWSTGARTSTIQVNAIGNYYVDLTSPAPENCTIRKNFRVSRQLVPEIKAVTFKETTVTIEVTNPAPYFEYSLDNNSYQSSNIFTNAPAGIQTAYVRDATYCNWDREQFIVINPPRFFTPNNDGFNDVWYVKDFEIYPKATISIFDQFGKLLIELSPLKLSWDGSFNQRPLPSSDYWYVLKLDDSGVEKRGHFSLKR